MDPRISVAWCKRNEVPIEKIFSKTMRDKFNWSMAVPPDWQFNEEISKQEYSFRLMNVGKIFEWSTVASADGPREGFPSSQTMID